MFDNKKYIECPQEEATHVYFAGNVHLSATDKQDVHWCYIDARKFYFFDPGKQLSDYYASWRPTYAPKDAQVPVFLKEKELEVKFAWSNCYEGVLEAEVDGAAIVLIILATRRIRKYNDPGDPNAIHFDDYWTIRQIKDAAAEYARKIARGEL